MYSSVPPPDLSPPSVERKERAEVDKETGERKECWAFANAQLLLVRTTQRSELPRLSPQLRHLEVAKVTGFLLHSAEQMIGTEGEQVGAEGCTFRRATPATHVFCQGPTLPTRVFVQSCFPFSVRL